MIKPLLPLLLLLAGPAFANSGLADLQQALARFKNQTPLKAQLSYRGESQGGDDAGTAAVQLPLEDGPAGLRLVYPQPLLAKAEQEDAAKDKDPKADTPTVKGLRELGLTDLRDMARAADSLQRRLARASFKGEKMDAWQGQPARRLSFELENNRPNTFVKEYSGLLEVWINEQGVPLASRALQKVSGRAYVVISFDMSNEDEAVYQVVGDRLLTTRKSSKGSGSGAGERGQQQRLLTLQLS
jgi:hypothetical protein